MVFNRPGFSKFGITAMLNEDLNAIANMVVDVVVAYLYPRIRLMERGE